MRTGGRVRPTTPRAEKLLEAGGSGGRRAGACDHLVGRLDHRQWVRVALLVVGCGVLRLHSVSTEAVFTA